MVPDISGIGRASFDLAQLLLKKAGVAIGAGLAYSAEGYLRVNFTSPRIGEALGRIHASLKEIRDA